MNPTGKPLAPSPCRLDEDVLKSARALLEEFDDKNLTYAFNATFRIVES
jgi:hypothetical protein